MSQEDNTVQLRVIEGNPRLIDLTREELTVISDVMRRLEPPRQGLPDDLVTFVARPEFASALAKINDGQERAWSAAAAKRALR
jgi:hypothetical protein